MALSGIGSIPAKGYDTFTIDRQESLADSMKDIRKRSLQRKVLADPQMATKLIAIEASPVYNSRGELIPSVGSGF